MTNGSFISISIKTGIVSHLMTTNKKKRIRKEIRLREIALFLEQFIYEKISLNYFVEKKKNRVSTH
jgi:hypothetical protein